MNIAYKETRDISLQSIIQLYKANQWSSANKPEELYQALMNSHSLVSAWDGDTLVGIANTLSDGFLVVYYPHMLILPEYQGKGIGREIMKRLVEKYKSFHMQILVSDGETIDFYEKCGFKKASNTQSMWIYNGNDH